MQEMESPGFFHGVKTSTSELSQNDVFVAASVLNKTGYDKNP